MLFHSAAFLFAFLPAVLAGTFALDRLFGRRAAIAWLVAASFVFYAWAVPAWALLLGGSVAFNFAVGRRLEGAAPHGGARGVLAFGVAANLALLGWFKYAGFFLDNVAWIAGRASPALDVALPIGISFFTFQNVAYLVDAQRGRARTYGLLEYALFIAFFPQLIAGPIVHHEELIPQLRRADALRPDAARLATGAAIFVVGLFKKVVVADRLALFADPGFAAAAASTGGGADAPLGALAAWGATLAFSLQIYFDFSGYTDMAIGLGRMFGVALPDNFLSPYKATSIVDFWRRWHVTLSRFLRDYVYIPLGGNRHGRPRRYANLMATMLLGGLWHGASWTFVAWGGLHGALLVANHGFRRLRRARGWTGTSAPGRALATLATTLAVVVAWVFFRADSFGTAAAMLASMAGAHGAGGDAPTFAGAYQALWLAAGFAAVWTLPTSRELIGDASRPVVHLQLGARRIGAVPSALAFGVLLFAIVGSSLDAGTQQFIYFQF
ncbi:MAG: MBOAT family protein [Myxococcales bacterium]|nr:MBOAT family protein [Myxococcales bacterium]